MTKKKQHIVKKPTLEDQNARKRKKPKYKSFRLHKRLRYIGTPLPSSWSIGKKAFRLLGANSKNILKFVCVYGLLYVLFVRGISSPVNIDEIRQAFTDVVGTQESAVVTNFTVFGLLLQSTTSAAGDLSALYQMFFLVISSLALIWLFRQQQAGNAVTIKDAFYRGMYPFIPFLLIIILIAVQTLPATIGNFLFSTVTSTGLAINATEQVAWLLLFLLTILLSLYLISTSIVALFIVTLPEMTPMRALRKAKELVNLRRLSLIRKIFALMMFVLIAFVAIVFPSLFVSTALAQIAFLLLTIMMVPFSVAYLFVLYRELL